jgi:rubredoxin
MANDASMTPCVCTICGHVYDPAAGRPEMGIAPGTPFAGLPEGWCCPVCSAEKPMFRER